MITKARCFGGLALVSYFLVPFYPALPFFPLCVFHYLTSLSFAAFFLFSVFATSIAKLFCLFYLTVPLDINNRIHFCTNTMGSSIGVQWEAEPLLQPPHVAWVPGNRNVQGPTENEKQFHFRSAQGRLELALLGKIV